MMLWTTCLVMNVASTWFLAGLIWFVQAVHYPAFADVDASAFLKFHANHTRRTTAVVVAPMVIELATAVALLIAPASVVSPMTARVGLALVIAIWISTFAVQVPLHTALSRSYDPDRQRSLCRTNWTRTILWTARALLMGAAVLWLLRKSG